jgi:MFS family permease
MVEFPSLNPSQEIAFETDIHERLDRLPWTRFHTRVVVALGVTWILDGLEVTLVGSLAGALRESPALHFTNTDIGLVGSAYLSGAVLGALLFGWLTDRYGRRILFFMTLSIYLLSTGATAISWDVWSFALFRFLTGAGIGGEYAAINSAIQELIPARFRGRSDLIVNGSFWIGAAVGAVGSIIVLDPSIFARDIGWRVAFLIGALLGVAIIFMRLWIPESPRWLIAHGYPRDAEAILARLESAFYLNREDAPLTSSRPRVRPRGYTPFAEVARTLLQTYRDRTLVGLSLMAAQAFFYNAIFFTYALILTDFYGVRADQVGWYILPFAAGNFLGPLTLGHLFDTLGRRLMIGLTYAISGVLLAATGYLFSKGLLSVELQTVCWMVIFYFGSAAASSAYLTLGEVFPIEIRALAIAIFYALGTGIGGVAGPWLFSILIDTGSRMSVFYGYLLGSIFMIAAAAIEWRWGIAAERKPLEAVARPLSYLD